MKQSDAGKRQVLTTIVREELFSRVKFVNREDLKYSLSPGTICHFVLERLVACSNSDWDKAEFWGDCKQLVIKKITDQRNNCIQAINAVTKGASKSAKTVK